MSNLLAEVAMSDRSDPSAEAARALRDVDRRRSQARASMPIESRWVSVVAGVVVFVLLAAPDVFGEWVRPWINFAMLGLLAVYEIMRRTRRGSSALGRPTLVRKVGLASPGSAYFVRLGLIAVLAVAAVVALVQGYRLFPYAGVVLGALLGGALIVFGPAWHRYLAALTMRGRRGEAGAVDGPR